MFLAINTIAHVEWKIQVRLATYHESHLSIMRGFAGGHPSKYNPRKAITTDTDGVYYNKTKFAIPIQPFRLIITLPRTRPVFYNLLILHSYTNPVY